MMCRCSLDDRVLLCLKRSLRIANAAQQMANVTRGTGGPVTLFVEILNKCVGALVMNHVIYTQKKQEIYTSMLNGRLNFLLWCFRYLYFFEKGNPQVTSAAIQDLIELIKTEMQSDTATPDPASDAFFACTLRYIEFQKQKGGAMGEKYDSVRIWRLVFDHSFHEDGWMELMVIVVAAACLLFCT